MLHGPAPRMPCRNSDDFVLAAAKLILFLVNPLADEFRRDQDQLRFNRNGAFDVFEWGV